jgi:hypothetical protein
MFINNIIKYIPSLNTIRHVIDSYNLLESLLDIKLDDEEELTPLKNMKAYLFANKIQNNLELEDPNLVLFKYIIGIKKTPTNLLYHATHMNGEIIVANTKNKILSKLETYKIDSNSVTGLNQLILNLINEIKKTVTKDSPVMLHLHDFKDYESTLILNTLASQHKINIRAVVLTNTNPHNGCRPPKIKTKTRLNFQHSPKKIYQGFTKNNIHSY